MTASWVDRLSTAGSRFVECILSVVATCRQQRRNVWDYLTACHEVTHAGRPIPSLLRTPRTARVTA